jgi:hypothetical protein
MSGWGFDETGRALDAETRDKDDEPDPFKLAARAQSADVAHALEVIQRSPTPDNMPELLRHARALPDLQAVLLGGARPLWSRWLPALEHARLDLHARRDLAHVAQRLPESERIQVLERVFRVPIGSDAGAIDTVDDLLDDAAEAPVADAETAVFEDDATLHLDGAGLLVADLLDGPTSAPLDAVPEAPAEEALWIEGAEQRVGVAHFVRACAPHVTDRGRAEAVLNQRFAGGEPPEDTAAWWRAVRRLRRRFPTLVDALEAARDEASGPVIVQGGVARVDLARGSLGIVAPLSDSE